MMFQRNFRLAKDSQQPDENDSEKNTQNNSGRGTEGQLNNRLEDLERKLQSRRKEEAIPDGKQSDSAGFSKATRMSTDFVVAILVGAGIGWGIDKFFGTAPWAMILFLLLGFCAGVLNVMRSAGLIAENRVLRPGSGVDTKERNDNN